jgi:hypothetical protein
MDLGAHLAAAVSTTIPEVVFVGVLSAERSMSRGSWPVAAALPRLHLVGKLEPAVDSSNRLGRAWTRSCRPGSRPCSTGDRAGPPHGARGWAASSSRPSAVAVLVAPSDGVLDLVRRRPTVHTGQWTRSHALVRVLVTQSGRPARCGHMRRRPPGRRHPGSRRAPGSSWTACWRGLGRAPPVRPARRPLNPRWATVAKIRAPHGAARSLFWPTPPWRAPFAGCRVRLFVGRPHRTRARFEHACSPSCAAGLARRR